MQSQIPLAWKNLTHSWRRLMVAVGGISFAVVLMFMQTGFRNALFDSTVKMVRDIDTDVIMFSKARFSLSAQHRFPIERIHEAASCPSAESVDPLYLENTISLLRADGRQGRPIRVIGFDLNCHLFAADDITAKLDLVHGPNTALIDSRSKPNYHFPLSEIAAGQPATGELAGQQVYFLGTFPMGTDFANEGNVIMSAENFASYFPSRRIGADPLSIVDLGLATARDGVTAEQLRDEILATLGPTTDVYVVTRNEFVNDEIRFWGKSTPIGIIFGIGTAMGFVVGVIICYQIIFTDIADHMPEFATLKAMGYSDRYFTQFVITEAFYLSIFGFVPGLLIAILLFAVVTSQTGLLMVMTLPRATIVFVLTLTMCVLSGIAAMRKLQSADPASLF
ncbi:MAG: FtsX-like permease family protein [Planctomycetales bacterium]|nr:FtsX-like permease family protein [Planctomycetales bacterium]